MKVDEALKANSPREFVAVLGQGYVGLPLSLAAHAVGWKVKAIDIDQNKVRNLRQGFSHIEDVSEVDLKTAISQGLEFSSDLNLISDCKIVIICVPTPLDNKLEPDLTLLERAVKAVAKFARNHTLLINESTSFPSTTRELIPRLVFEISPNLELLYAVAPERVDPGNKQWNYQQTPRLVAGLTEEATNRTIDFYSSFCEKVIRVSSPEVAEFSKVLENSFRQVNIALVNELVPLAQDLGVSLYEVIEAASTKPYGYMPFWPGVGVGGHCIPVDPMYLSWFAKSRGKSASIIEASQQVNDAGPARVFEIIKSLDLPKESLVLQVGLAYKAGVSDLRESPSLSLFQLLQIEYKNLDWWDNSLQEWNAAGRSNLQSDYDLVVLTHRCENPELELTIRRSRKVLDLTGQFRGLSNVLSI